MMLLWRKVEGIILVYVFLSIKLREFWRKILIDTDELLKKNLNHTLYLSIYRMTLYDP